MGGYCASQDLVTCLITDSELFCISSSLTHMFWVSQSLVNNTSYSTSLFMALKLNKMTYFNFTLSDSMR